MTLGDIAKKARSLVNASITTYPDANLLIDINIWLQNVGTMILESQDEADFDDQRNTDFPILNTAFVLNGTDNLYSKRDYSIPVAEKMLKFKRLDITYDGVNWYKAEPIDSKEIEIGMGTASSTVQEANLDALFSKTSPRYDIKYGSIFVYPRATASDIASGASMQAEWSRQVTPYTTSDYSSVLTDSTVTPGFDDPFHIILAYGAALEFATSKTLPQAKGLQAKLIEYEQRLKQAYSSKQKDRQFVIGADIPSYSSKGRGLWNWVTNYIRP